MRAGDATAWDERYRKAADGGTSVWSWRPTTVVADLLEAVPAGTGVDLGAGEGRNALWLAERGWQVTAVDFSDVGLDVGRGEAGRRGLQVAFVTADATTWAAPAQVDLVLVAYLHLPHRALAPTLARAATWVAPGGNLLVVGHDRDNPEHGHGGPQDPDVLYDTDLLTKTTATSGLHTARCEQLERLVPTPEGTATAIDTLLWASRPR
ncbi:class I SAM-dependent methyltransferase [uncultured Pseudokineococcus sp.]|uniref:class I SAM-dependent methyltransferase n=1 Tax=uncultured Pseudokineococcus sp. TaxID=1642928 RepID=UPI0026149A66|nr:class I SAM-dependent methyltransferase [uncultured Pseudokineococcus sp.]